MDFALHPRAIARRAAGSITNFTPRGVVPMTDITPVTLLGMSAKARAVRSTRPAMPVHGVAIRHARMAASRCSACFSVRTMAPVSLDDLQQIDDALGLERYTPRLNLSNCRRGRLPRPGIQFPLGDARKQWEEERKLQQKEYLPVLCGPAAALDFANGCSPPRRRCRCPDRGSRPARRSRRTIPTAR